MNKCIKWLKWKSPITKMEDGEDSIAVRQTPFGVEAFKLNSDKSNALNIYVGNTNFDLTEREKNIIKNIDGVEGLVIVSSYRFHVAIGIAFNTKKVRRLITTALCQSETLYNFSPEINAEIYTKTLSLKQNGYPWLLYITPNGKTKEFIFKDESSLEDNITKYYNIQKRIGGIILSS